MPSQSDDRKSNYQRNLDKEEAEREKDADSPDRRTSSFKEANRAPARPTTYVVHRAPARPKTDVVHRAPAAYAPVAYNPLDSYEKRMRDYLERMNQHIGLATGSDLNYIAREQANRSTAAQAAEFMSRKMGLRGNVNLSRGIDFQNMRAAAGISAKLPSQIQAEREGYIAEGDRLAQEYNALSQQYAQMQQQYAAGKSEMQLAREQQELMDQQIINTAWQDMMQKKSDFERIKMLGEMEGSRVWREAESAFAAASAKFTELALMGAGKIGDNSKDKNSNNSQNTQNKGT